MNTFVLRLGNTGFSLYVVFVLNAMWGRPTCPCEAGSLFVACLRRFSGASTGSRPLSADRRGRRQ
jgi:hypothetical protein